MDKICVAYKTGHVLVGNIEGIAYISCAFGRDRPSACAGKRYWWKDLNIEIDHVAWSPDSSIVMLGGKEGAFQVLDANGNFISNISFNVKVDLFPCDLATPKTLTISSCCLLQLLSNRPV